MIKGSDTKKSVNKLTTLRSARRPPFPSDWGGKARQGRQGPFNTEFFPSAFKTSNLYRPLGPFTGPPFLLRTYNISCLCMYEKERRQLVCFRFESIWTYLLFVFTLTHSVVARRSSGEVSRSFPFRQILLNCRMAWVEGIGKIHQRTSLDE